MNPKAIDLCLKIAGTIWTHTHTVQIPEQPILYELHITPPVHRIIPTATPPIYYIHNANCAAAILLCLHL